MNEPVRQNEEVVHAAAAILVLLEGPACGVSERLAGMASAELLDGIERRLTAGDRASRARALAGPLGRIALELESWRLA